MDSKKLEILLVEDTPENMIVAKGYFDTVQDINVTYATNRDDALKLIEEKKFDGVITDRSMPGKENEDIDSIWEGSSGLYLENNGWSVGMKAEVMKTPWIIHSEHGKSLYFYIGKHLPEQKEIFEKGNKLYSKGLGIPDGTETTFDDFLTKCDVENVDEFVQRFNEKVDGFGAQSYLSDKGVDVQSNIRFDLDKKNVESWKVALNYIRQQIETKTYD